MQDYFLEERGIAYRTNEIRAGRQTLVFIHGLSGSASAWFPFEERFDGRYNIVTFDLRGHGLSRKPRRYRDYDLSEFAHDLEALLAHLELKRCTLVCHSFGTLVGLQYLHAHPGRAQRIVFMSPTYVVRATRRARIMEALLPLLMHVAMLLPFSDKPRGRVDYRRFAHTGDFNLRRLIADVRNTSLRVYLFGLEHAYRFNKAVWWHKLSQPALILHGCKDKIIPYRNAKHLAAHLPQAQLVVLKQTDHVMVLNDVAEVEQAVDSFLDEQP